MEMVAWCGCCHNVRHCETLRTDRGLYRAPKNWQGAGMTKTKRKHQLGARNVAAHHFEEQHGSRNGRAYETEPTKRKHRVKHAVCSTPPSKRSAAAGAAELGPMEATKRKHRASATSQHTISRNSAASAAAAELRPMKQRHTGMGATNIRNGTGNKKLSELQYK
ncbi:hypothetical protein EDD85DRAFT_150531 [Armillaria nabsnona]|nr:hypothetical protein EDD85DRAFT_150531 [Armillaria nabsnona]